MHGFSVTFQVISWDLHSLGHADITLDTDDKDICIDFDHKGATDKQAWLWLLTKLPILACSWDILNS